MNDGRDHAVTDDEFVRRGERPPGYYQAICGYLVNIAPAAASSRPPCERCLSILRVHRQTARHPKSGLLRRLLSRFSLGYRNRQK
jgi:hypothetical protein